MSPRNTFRSHDQMPAPMPAAETFRLLCQEWVALNQSAGDAVSSWGHTAPQFAGLDTPGDVVDAIDQATPKGRDEILCALLELARGGDRLAGRIVLQAMLPLLCRFARQCSMPADITDADERAQFTVTTFWEVLASTTRGENITRHLRMKTLHVITEAAHARSRRRSTDTWEHRTDHHGLPEDLTEVGGEDGIECDEILTPETDLYGVLRWARTTHVLSAGDAQLLADVYLTDRRRPDFTRAARRSGLELRTCQRRTAAARERLALAVRQDLAGTREISASAAA